jgi:hypothetical protein
MSYKHPDPIRLTAEITTVLAVICSSPLLASHTAVTIINAISAIKLILHTIAMLFEMQTDTAERKE